MPEWELLLPRGRRLEVGRRGVVVGILNVTPDSFSDGGSYPTAEDAIRAGVRSIAEGADVLDVGGESTRPGALPVPPEVQEQRILPVIRGIRALSDVPISVDTQSARVAESAFEAGADILNDVSACRDPAMKDVLGRHQVPVILMHMKGTPLDMQVSPEYPEGVVPAVIAHLRGRLTALETWGVDRSRTVLDPGIGFGKRLQHNLELIRNIKELAKLGRPVLIGASRKGFIDKALGRDGGGSNEGSHEDAGDKDLGTLIVNAFALERGCHMLRVHNVRYASALVRLRRALEGEGGESSRGLS